MKTLLTLSSLPFLLSSCMVMDFEWQQGNGVAATEIRSLPSFDRVRLEAPVHVIVKTGPAYSAYVTSDANLTGYFTTDTWGGTLTIGMSSGIDPVVEPVITIVVPDLRGLVHNGDGLVEVLEDGEFPDLDLTLNGGGEIFFSGTASHLHAALNGSGSIEMEGYAADLSADLRGSGEIHAENLLAGNADVSLSGSGFLFLDLDYQSTLDLVLSGPGQVEWWGSPARLDYSITGSGQVIEHRGLPKKSAAAEIPAAGNAGAAAAAAKSGAGAYDEVPAKPAQAIPFAKAAGHR
jgi:hypothetical protein